jgi:hypothetical protein
MDSPEIRCQLLQEMIAFIDGIRQSEEAQTNLIRGNKPRSQDKMRKVGCDALEGKRETLG